MQRAGSFLVYFFVFSGACADALDIEAPGETTELLSAVNARAEVPEASEPDAFVRDPEIDAMVSAVTLSRMSADLSTLVGFRTRNSCSTSSSLTVGIGAARSHVRSQFRAIPLDTADDAFTSSFCGSSKTHRNVYAWIPGTDPLRIIVIGGHLDSRSTDGSSPTQNAPGANDSGSQASLVMEAARVMAGHTFRATVVFVTFTGEEQGLRGSNHFVSQIASIFPGATVEAALINDIVGGDVSANTDAMLHQFRLFSPGTPREKSSSTPNGTSDDTSPARGIMRHVGTWGGLYVPDMGILPNLREDRPGRGSDHTSFLDTGIPGVRFIETAENTSHQHSANDLIANMTPAYMARMTMVVVASAASLARAPSSPRSFVASGSNSSPVTVSWAAATPGAIDHYVIAARPITSNFYASRIVVSGSAASATISPSELGIPTGTSFFISVAAIDADGHESLFAYPEVRCSTVCEVQPNSLNVTMTL
jgi:Peptidase family M28